MSDQPTEKRKRGRPRGTNAKTQISTVVALDRGLVLLQALARLPNVTLGDLAQHVNMPPSTTHRILATLQAHHFADFDTHAQEWSIGIGAFRVGSAFLSGTNLIEASQKVMRPLMERTGETANLGIAEAGNIVFVSQVETKNPIRAMFRQGTGSPMHASGIGKAMLAEMKPDAVAAMLANNGQPAFTEHTITSPEELFSNLETVSDQGWALDNEERFVGMRCVAAAVFGSQGKPIAGLSISGPTARFSDREIKKFGPIVVEAANTLTAAIGGLKP